VRELMNIINSAVIIESSNELKKDSLPHYFLENLKSTNHVNSEYAHKTLQEIEKEHIKKVLALNEWNKSRASKVLGISRVSLISKVKKYNLE